jgi:capsular exopolysaccharide synthesis family protein
MIKEKLGLKSNHTSINTTQLINKETAPFNFVEAYKSLRTNLEFSCVNNNYKKIIITSTVMGEGKSTVAINLALTLQSKGSRVLLVDCDLRRPMIQKYLKFKDRMDFGLTKMLTDPDKRGILSVNGTNLYLILSGPIPPNPAELLGSDKMGELVRSVEEDFDYIIFDAPPAVVTDAAVLSKWCDGVILVVKQNLVARDTVLMAKQSLENVGAKIIGCVFNDFKMSKSGANSAYRQYYKKDYEYENKEKK